MPAPRKILTNANISLFGEFARFLDDAVDEGDGKAVCLDLTCLICQVARLEVPGRVRVDVSSSSLSRDMDMDMDMDMNNHTWTSTSNHSSSSSEQPPTNTETETETEYIAILPCGHFFGSTCLERWMMTCDANSPHNTFPFPPNTTTTTSAHCPICRYEMRHASCGHILTAREYDPEYPRSEQIPPTIPEAGGGAVDVVQDRCLDCWQGDYMDELGMYTRDMRSPRYDSRDLEEMGWARARMRERYW
ncbi:hypothetical protein GGS20DRAFT_531655 [Poronia punctata]|nr:hypothetical protein GGS20DRAFT_531655 [Poronia punctata]